MIVPVIAFYLILNHLMGSKVFSYSSFVTHPSMNPTFTLTKSPCNQLVLLKVQCSFARSIQPLFLTEMIIPCFCIPIHSCKLPVMFCFLLVHFHAIPDNINCPHCNMLRDIQLESILQQNKTISIYLVKTIFLTLTTVIDIDLAKLYIQYIFMNGLNDAPHVPNFSPCYIPLKLPC